MIQFSVMDLGEKYEVLIEGKKSDLLLMMLDAMESDENVKAIIIGSLLAYEAKTRIGIFDKMKKELEKAGPWPK